jgi:hypothetical protein
MATEEVQPTTIDSLFNAVPGAYALHAGLQLDVFTALASGPLSAVELAPIVNGDPRRLSGLLYYLVGIGLLTVADKRFANTPEADRWLVRGRPNAYVDGTSFRSEMYVAYSKTVESIRAGHALANHDYTAMPPDELLVAYQSFDQGARRKGAWLANAFDFATTETMIDVAGGSGGLSVTLTECHPHIRATVADLPSVIPLTEHFLREAGALKRVQTVALDLLATPIPGSYDVAVLCNLVHLFTPENAAQVLVNVGAAVRPGGTIYIIGYAVDDTRLAPMEALWGNFISISIYEHAQAHTESEYRTWLENAGFRDIDVRWTPLAGVPVVMIARKQS